LPEHAHHLPAMDFFTKIHQVLCCTTARDAPLDPPGAERLGSAERLKLRAARLKEMAEDAERLADDIEKQEKLITRGKGVR